MLVQLGSMRPSLVATLSFQDNGDGGKKEGVGTMGGLAGEGGRGKNVLEGSDRRRQHSYLSPIHEMWILINIDHHHPHHFEP